MQPYLEYNLSRHPQQREYQRQKRLRRVYGLTHREVEIANLIKVIGVLKPPIASRRRQRDYFLERFPCLRQLQARFNSRLHPFVFLCASAALREIFP